jgi:Asp-tRNA(Asn)/Glu-tRNA(Gln) amidotransferase A subunit family amidase
MSELPATLQAAAELICDGQVEPLELVEGCLARIEELDPDIHAWVEIDAHGARESALKSGELLRTSGWLGPLHGIPIGIKDIIDVAGMPTRAGSPLREQHLAERDAPIVSRLRELGAIVLGKTVTTQFACFDPASTVNPHNHERTPGGSSSGSAAALAAGMCYAALGTQTGGSIIRPAAYCGVAGLKPTYGAISTDGVVPVSLQLDHVGPMARTASDLWITWNALSDAGDLNQLRKMQAETPVPRLVIPESYFYDQLHAAIRPQFQSTIANLTVAGADFGHVPLPSSFEEVHAMHRRIMAVDAAEYHRETYANDRSAYSPNIAGLIEEGLGIAAVDYAAAVKHKGEFERELFDCFGDGETVWITPSTPGPVPTRETTGDPSFNSPWTYAGFPSLTLPCGTSDDGLPLGLQLIARPRCESTLLTAALWCERMLSS